MSNADRPKPIVPDSATFGKHLSHMRCTFSVLRRKMAGKPKGVPQRARRGRSRVAWVSTWPSNASARPVRLGFFPSTTT